MTRDEAENLVENLLQSCVDYERAEKWEAKRARDEYRQMKEAVIVALVSKDGQGVTDNGN